VVRYQACSCRPSEPPLLWGGGHASAIPRSGDPAAEGPPGRFRPASVWEARRHPRRRGPVAGRRRLAWPAPGAHAPWRDLGLSPSRYRGGPMDL